MSGWYRRSSPDVRRCAGLGDEARLDARDDARLLPAEKRQSPGRLAPSPLRVESLDVVGLTPVRLGACEPVRQRGAGACGTVDCCHEREGQWFIVTHSAVADPGFVSARTMTIGPSCSSPTSRRGELVVRDTAPDPISARIATPRHGRWSSEATRLGKSPEVGSRKAGGVIPTWGSRRSGFVLVPAQ